MTGETNWFEVDMSDEKESDWFRNVSGAVTHYCGGVPTNKEVIDRHAKTGEFGNIKHEKTNTELSKWFYPAELQEDQARVEAGFAQKYKCKACGKLSPDTVATIEVGDNDESS
jgi:hypothetical protein